MKAFLERCSGAASVATPVLLVNDLLVINDKGNTCRTKPCKTTSVCYSDLREVVKKTILKNALYL